MGERCRLCLTPEAKHFAKVRARDYFRCNVCDLTFLAFDQLPLPGEERAEYDLHNNDPFDARYRKHLAKLTVPLLADVPTSAKGLDFGCGPGPTISVMLGERGYDVANYDPAFFPDKRALVGQYDFITCTEVVEHFHNPAAGFTQMAGLLKPGGKLGIMTAMVHKDVDFADWYYIREISHVAFYSKQSLEWIAEHFGWNTRFFDSVVVVMC